MSDFKRETRYLVLKRKHLNAAAEKDISAALRAHGVAACECVVVEHDWPIYEQTWDAVQRLAEGRVQELDEYRVNAQERERLKMELSSVLDYDAPNPSMCDLVVEAQLMKQERNAAFGRIAELEQAERLQIQLREKAQAERDALAAHVERIISEWSACDDIFSDAWIDRMAGAIEDEPAASLARRDAIKQAEAMRHVAKWLSGEIEEGCVGLDLGGEISGPTGCSSADKCRVAGERIFKEAARIWEYKFAFKEQQ